MAGGHWVVDNALGLGVDGLGAQRSGTGIHEMDYEVGSGIARIFTDSKKYVIRQMLMTLHLYDISET